MNKNPMSPARRRSLIAQLEALSTRMKEARALIRKSQLSASRLSDDPALRDHAKALGPIADNLAQVLAGVEKFVLNYIATI
jgi:hypothetical protein